MEIYGSTTTKFRIKPLSVIIAMIDNSIGSTGWVFKEGEKYYNGWENGRNHEDKEEITKDQYDYVMALKAVKKFLEDNPKVNS